MKPEFSDATKAVKPGPMPGRKDLNKDSPKEPQDIDRLVGSRVRMQRMAIGMSQEKLGEACGITFQQIQKYEKGMNRMGASRLHQIARILQVPVEFFYEGAPSEAGSGGLTSADRSSRSMTDFLGASEGLELVKAFMSVKDAKVRRRIVDLTRAASKARHGYICRPATDTNISSGCHRLIELRRLLDGDLRGARSAKEPIDLVCDPFPVVDLVRTVRHQPAPPDVLAEWYSGREAMAKGELHERRGDYTALPRNNEERVPLQLPVGRSDGEHDVHALLVAPLLQRAPQRLRMELRGGRRQHANAAPASLAQLLRAGRERPDDNYAGKPRDYLPAPHSITSLARSRNSRETSR